MLDQTPDATLDAMLGRLNDALERGDARAAAALFQADSYWRDLVAFTWNLRTMEGPDQILAMLESQLPKVRPGSLRLDPAEAASTSGDVTEGWIEFETETGRGYGHIRLKDGLIWTLLTTLSELKGHEEPKGLRRPMGAEHGHGKGRTTWKEKREAEAAELGYTTQPYVVIIGGGQGGIALGARLRQLGVPTIIVDKHPRPGDQWRKRYKSLCLHDPVWYDHLPYIPFPENWPVFTPKDKIGDWLEILHENHGAHLLELDHGEVGAVRRSGRRVGRHRRPRRRGGRAAAEAAGAGDRHVGQGEHAGDPGPGRLQGRAAAFEPASRPGRLCRQEGGRHRLEQLGARHLRGALGGGRRRDDGAAVLDPHRAVRHADGHRPRRPLLRARGGERHHHAQGGSHLRVAALQDHARVADPALREDEGARRRLLCARSRSAASCSTGAPTTRASS